MKFRKGFVSNSSSSSFIFVFDRPITTIEQLKEEMMSGYEYQFKFYDMDEIARTLLKDFGMPNNWEKIQRELYQLASLMAYQHCNFGNRNDEKEMAAKYLKQYEEKYTELIKDRFIYVVEYGDWEEPLLESGEIFFNLDFEQVSHH